MAVYFDCIQFEKTKNDKTFARNIGSAMKRDDGGFNVYLKVLPITGEFVIAPKRDNRGTGRREPGEDDRGGPGF